MFDKLWPLLWGPTICGPYWTKQEVEVILFNQQS